MRDPIAEGLEQMFARSEPVCAAWVRREEAYDYVQHARPDELLAALIDWRRACTEYADVVIASALERAAAPRESSGCVSVFHDTTSCRDGLLPVSDWCAPCLTNAPVNTRRLHVVPDLDLVEVGR